MHWPAEFRPCFIPAITTAPPVMCVVKTPHNHVLVLSSIAEADSS